MKFPLLVLISVFASFVSVAQLKTTPVCPPVQVEIISGNVNKLSPKSTLGEVKITLPCFSEVIEEPTGTSCKAVIYKDRGLYFYPERNYIEIRENFDGKMNPKLIGADRKSLFSMLGYPKIKDITWDAFQMEYGILILYYDKTNKINKIQISSKTVDNIKLCD